MQQPLPSREAVAAAFARAKEAGTSAGYDRPREGTWHVITENNCGWIGEGRDRRWVQGKGFTVVNEFDFYRRHRYSIGGALRRFTGKFGGPPTEVLTSYLRVEVAR